MLKEMIMEKSAKITGKWVLVALLLLPAAGMLQAQADLKQIRKGNEEFTDKKYNQSEISYRKALDANTKSVMARYNLADALYKQGRYQESSDILSGLSKETDNPAVLSGIYHNLGNALLKDKKIQESIDAYKNSLRINPADDQTRYNLAYAQALLKQQQNQDQNNKNNKDQNKDQNKKQNQDQKKDKDNKQNQDQNKDQKKDQNKNQAKQDQQQNQQGQDKQQQPQPKQGMSKEEADRLLQAIMNNEKQTRDKVNTQQFKAKKVHPEKDW